MTSDIRHPTNYATLATLVLATPWRPSPACYSFPAYSPAPEYLEVSLLSQIRNRNRKHHDTDITTMLKEKRTNSLAFSQTDCHSCTSAGRACDRRRPQCSTCLGLGVKCGGFVTPLSWDNNRIWLGQPSQKKRHIYDSNRGNQSPKASPRAFRFVDASSRRKRRRRVSPVSSPEEEICRASESPEEIGINSYLAHSSDSLLDDFGRRHP